MTPETIGAIAKWIAQKGIEGQDELPLLNAFCERCRAEGLPIARAIVIIDTLHPVYEGRAFRWREDETTETPLLEFKRGDAGVNPNSWTDSPFNHLLKQGGGELRCKLFEGETGGFEAIQEQLDQGQTDYIAFVHLFAPHAKIGEMDNLATRFTTSRPGGFTEAEITALRVLAPTLGLAIKSASLTRVAEAIAETYLGRDAGRRVLDGKMIRGTAEKINSVLWFSDMHHFTTLSDTIPADRLIPLLDDYAEEVIGAISDSGGDVLKLIGDGILAIFNQDDPGEACMAAMAAEASMRERLLTMNAERDRMGEPVAEIYLGLHIGDVFYGNIGSQSRLDFTVVGAAVNEVSRIASLCSSVDRSNLFSADFVAALPPAQRSKLVSVGRFALRGVGRAKELFTIDPELVPGTARYRDPVEDEVGAGSRSG